QFSLPYAVSVALVTGSARMEAFSDQRLADPRVRDLLKRVHLSVDPQADAAYPRQRAATVTIRMRSGQVLSEYAPTRKGDPDNPLTDDDLTDKFMELVTPVTGGSEARALLSTLWRIDALDDLAALPLPSSAMASAGASARP